MKVKATKRGFDGTCIREPDDVFDMPDTTKVKGEDGKVKEVPVTGSWFEAVDAKAEKKASKDDKSLA